MGDNNIMDPIFNEYFTDVDSVFFRYAHLTGALEIYMLILEDIKLQKAFSLIMNGSENEWKQIHRYNIINGHKIEWYKELPIKVIIKEKNNLLGYLYGITLSAFVGSLDYCLCRILEEKYGIKNTSGNSWEQFIKTTGIDLLKINNGSFIYSLIQERHKIEHNKAKIDSKYIEKMVKTGIKNAYSVGDHIQKSHIDVLITNQTIRQFGEDLQKELLKKGLVHDKK